MREKLENWLYKLFAEVENGVKPVTVHYRVFDRNEQVFDALVAVCEIWGIEIRKVGWLVGAAAKSRGGEIILEREWHGAVQTLAHELAHELMHHPSECLDIFDSKQLELEAESVAYLVAKWFGIKETCSVHYLSYWEIPKELYARHSTRILVTAERIISRIEWILG